MGTYRGTREQYDAMVEAFREKPENYTNAARAAGCELRTARKGWNEGWDAPPWARPIKALFEHEQAALRSKLYEEEKQRQTEAARVRAEREKAGLDAAEEKIRESRAVRGAMNSAVTALATSGTLAASRHLLSQRVAEQVTAAAAKGDVSWKECLAVLTKLAWLDSQAVSLLRGAMDALRRHTGEPDKFMPATGFAADIDATNVDGPKAAEALGGSDNLRQAIKDLAEGNMTPLAEKLVSYQINAQATALAMKGVG